MHLPHSDGRSSETPRSGLSRLNVENDNNGDTRPDAVPAAPLSILMLSPHPSVLGGVSEFAQMLKAHFMRCDVTPFWIGSREESREGRLAAAGRVMATPFRLARLAHREEFDVVHINPSLTYKSAIRDALLLLSLRLIGYRRVLVYIHGWQDRVAARLRRTPGLRQFTAWLLNGTAHIMVLAPQFQRALEDMGVEAGRMTFTRTMFDGEGLTRAGETPPTQRRSVLFMSRFVHEKGIYQLVEAFARIADEFPGVDLIMAGDGQERARLQARAISLGLGDRVSFPGYVRGIEKTRLLRACSIYALPTYLGEGMPIALLEAMAVGKPLLTSKAGSIPHIVSDPENGVIIDAVTADAVEAGLRRLLSDPPYCHEVGRRNAAYAWQRFEARPVTADIERLYHHIAQRQ
jgi:glycosyltransferase involved in cell wall biosynthesis